MVSSQSGQSAQAHRYREQAHSYRESLSFQLIQLLECPRILPKTFSKERLNITLHGLAIPFASSCFTLANGATAAGSLVKRIIPLADLAGE
jgi:hypothetical protein